jgi:nitroreductase
MGTRRVEITPNIHQAARSLKFHWNDIGKTRIFYNAPCLVFIGGSKDIRSLQVDCALAASYFMFSATARGLGTCWIGLGTSIQGSKVRKQVGMHKDYKIVAPIVVGYPKIIPGSPENREAKILKVVF